MTAALRYPRELLARAHARAASLEMRAAKAQCWTPHDGPQREFFESDCEEVLYGGAAGGGKTMAATALPLPWIDHPDLRALILRRRTLDLNDLVDKAQKIYRHGDATSPRPFSAACPGVDFVASPSHKATFPGGARIYFDHCQNPDDWEKYQGQEYQIIVFEELTQFLEKQYLEIKSRLRSASPGLPRKIRATSNPGGRGAEWVFRRWKWWLDPEATIPGRAPRLDPKTKKKLPPAKPGEVLWIKRGRDGAEVVVEPNTPKASTRTFIPARLLDNPTLLASDPDYETRLLDNDPVRAKQLLEGDWLVRPAAGLYFRREWFTFVDEAPVKARRVRYWDKAASEPTDTYPDPDWTVGLKLAKADDGTYYVEHVHRMRGAPGKVKQAIRATAELDTKKVAIRMAQDPGSAGKSEAADYVQALTGYDVKTKPETGDKVTRAAPASSQASPQSTGGAVGRFCVVRGPWNEAFLQELEGFPDGAHDDQVDALSGAFEALSKPATARGVGQTPVFSFG